MNGRAARRGFALRSGAHSMTAQKEQLRLNRAFWEAFQAILNELCTRMDSVALQIRPKCGICRGMATVESSEARCRWRKQRGGVWLNPYH